LDKKPEIAAKINNNKPKKKPSILNYLKKKRETPAHTLINSNESLKIKIIRGENIGGFQRSYNLQW